MRERNEEINKSMRFTIESHRDVNQLYDGLPYYVHPQEVVDYINRFKGLLDEKDIINVMCSGWLHDVLEDTKMNYTDIKNNFNVEIADIVFLLTNHRGKVRKERANDDYYEGIKNDKNALFVKICDRLANMSHSLLYDNDDKFKMYKKELPKFKSKLYNGLYDEMWELLENLENSDISKPIHFPDLEMFDEKTIYWVKPPQPIPFSYYDEIYSKGIIRKKDLIKNQYYLGKCRNSDVAFWNGFEFLYSRYKFGSSYIDTINHPEDDNGYDLFIPLRIVEPTDNQRIKY